MRRMNSRSAIERLLAATAALAISAVVLSTAVSMLNVGDREATLARQQAVAQRAERARQLQLAIEEGINFAVTTSPNTATN